MEITQERNYTAVVKRTILEIGDKRDSNLVRIDTVMIWILALKS